MSTLAVDALTGNFEEAADSAPDTSATQQPNFTLENLKSAGTDPAQNSIVAVISDMELAEKSGDPSRYARIEDLIAQGRAAVENGELSFEQTNTLNMLVHWMSMSKVRQAQALKNTKTAVAAPGANGLG